MDWHSLKLINVGGLKARVRRLKSRVEATKPRVT